MGPMSSIVNFIKSKFWMTVITVTMVNGEEITGKVVEASDSLVGLEVGKNVIFINANQMVTFTQK